MSVRAEHVEAQWAKHWRGRGPFNPSTSSGRTGVGFGAFFKYVDQALVRFKGHLLSESRPSASVFILSP